MLRFRAVFERCADLLKDVCIVVRVLRGHECDFFGKAAVGRVSADMNIHRLLVVAISVARMVLILLLMWFGSLAIDLTSLTDNFLLVWSIHHLHLH